MFYLIKKIGNISLCSPCEREEIASRLPTFEMILKCPVNSLFWDFSLCMHDKVFPLPLWRAHCDIHHFAPNDLEKRVVIFWYFSVIAFVLPCLSLPPCPRPRPGH